MSSATSVLGIRAQTASTVLPMGGATLKMSRAVNNPVRLLFLAHVLGVDLTFERIVVFAISVIMLSAATVGVPTVVIGMRSLPAYIAAGIPAEYVALISVSVNLTDYFLTAINSSGYFSATAIVDRFAGKRAHAQVPIEVVAEIDAARQPMAEVR
jgi:Na+/H+-dicarboxylate symporter